MRDRPPAPLKPDDRPLVPRPVERPAPWWLRLKFRIWLWLKGRA